jgi:hypothetical protein
MTAKAEARKLNRAIRSANRASASITRVSKLLDTAGHNTNSVEKLGDAVTGLVSKLVELEGTAKENAAVEAAAKARAEKEKAEKPKKAAAAAKKTKKEKKAATKENDE